MIVETADLLNSCPIWKLLYEPSGIPLESPHLRQIRAIREAWSHKLVRVAGPSGPSVQVQVHDRMTYCQWFFRSHCKTTAYWKVIGPDALLDELAGAPCDPYPCDGPLNLYLCQHEIGGD
jgi:hypothetical protein